jgi:hypothetical protein
MAQPETMKPSRSLAGRIPETGKGRVSRVGESGGIFTALQKHTNKNFESNTQRIFQGSLSDVFKTLLREKHVSAVLRERR